MIQSIALYLVKLLRGGGLSWSKKSAKGENHSARGVEIIVTDYSGLKGPALAEAIKENAKIIVPRVIGRRDGVMVSLFGNCQLDEDSMEYITKIQKATAGFFVAGALLGMSKLQKTGIEITGAIRKIKLRDQVLR